MLRRFSFSWAAPEANGHRNSLPHLRPARQRRRTINENNGLLIQIGQAAFGALAFGLLAVSSFYLWLDWTGWRLFFFVFSLALVAIWARILFSWLHFALPSQEPKPEIVQAQEPQPMKIMIAETEGNYSKGVWLEIPGIAPEVLAEVAELVLAGHNFSMGSMSGRYKPLSRNQYEAMRDRLIESGALSWASDKSHSQGVTITKPGLALFRCIAQTYLPDDQSDLEKEFLRHTRARSHAQTHREARL